MYYVIEVINYKYSSPSHHLAFHSESLNEAREYKILKTKLAGNFLHIPRSTNVSSTFWQITLISEHYL